jgi:hypothetical protein
MMPAIRSSWLILIILMFSCPVLQRLHAQETARFMFYNVENLFDPYDDSLTQDDEYTPAGPKHWTYNRYHDKLLNISRVIVSVGGWDPPAMIGLCEVENDRVLRQLVSETPLVKYAYRYIHHESPDRRGIDVAFLYNPAVFKVVRDEAVRIILKEETGTTRDILYVCGTLWDSDTIHIFINHWPSRYAGVAASEPKRMEAALTLKHLVDSLFSMYRDPLVIIAGDFNDDLEDHSLSDCLNVLGISDHHDKKALYLLEYQREGGICGTAKYRSLWYEFDHVIVSGALLGTRPLHVMPPVRKVHHPDFLLTEDEKGTGLSPFRTYEGFRYQGGFSDHLPVYIDLHRVF